MLRFFTLLTGDRYQVVAQHGPASRKKVIATGTGLLLVTVLWFFTGFSLGTHAMGLGTTQAMFLGCALCMVVFLLDRMILLSVQSSIALVVVRCTLALCMAVIGSAGLDICLLRSEIDQALVTIHRERMEAAVQQVHETHSAALHQARTNVLDARATNQRAAALWLAELDGTAGTRQYGSGRVAAAKGSVVASSAHALEVSERILAELQGRIQHEAEQVEQGLLEARNTPALFDRLEALHRHVLQNHTTGIAYLILSVVLLLLELSPLLAKWGMPTTAYEQGMLAQDKLQREQIRTAMVTADEHHARYRALTEAERNAMEAIQQVRRNHASVRGLRPATPYTLSK